jgi:hypothetical protein
MSRRDRIPFTLSWKPGDRVLAQWDAYFYPGRVQLAEPTRCFVRFDDGDAGWVDSRVVLPLDVGLGSRVFGNWKGQGAYYPGVIDQCSGESIHINYDDGDHEWTTIDRVRVERAGTPLPDGVTALARALKAGSPLPPRRPAGPVRLQTRGPKGRGGLLGPAVVLGLLLHAVVFYVNLRAGLLLVAVEVGGVLTVVLAAKKRRLAAAACLLAGLALVGAATVGLDRYRAAQEAERLAAEFKHIDSGDWARLEKHRAACRQFLQDHPDYEATLAQAEKEWAQRCLDRVRRQGPAGLQDIADLKKQWDPLVEAFPDLRGQLEDALLPAATRDVDDIVTALTTMQPVNFQRFQDGAGRRAELAQAFPTLAKKLRAAEQDWLRDSAAYAVTVLGELAPAPGQGYAEIKPLCVFLETAGPAEAQARVQEARRAWGRKVVETATGKLAEAPPEAFQVLQDQAAVAAFLAEEFPELYRDYQAAAWGWLQRSASHVVGMLDQLPPEQWRAYGNDKPLYLFLESKCSGELKIAVQTARRAWGQRAAAAAVKRLAEAVANDFDTFQGQAGLRTFLAAEFPESAPALAQAEAAFALRSRLALEQAVAAVPAADFKSYLAGADQRAAFKKLFPASAADLQKVEAAWGLRTVAAVAKEADLLVKVKPGEASRQLGKLAAALQGCGSQEQAQAQLLERRRAAVKAWLEHEKRQARALLQRDCFQAAEQQAQAFLDAVRNEAEAVDLLDAVERFQQTLAALAEVARQADQPDPRAPRRLPAR